MITIQKLMTVPVIPPYVHWKALLWFSQLHTVLSLQKRGGCFDQCVWLPQLHYMTITCFGV